MLAGMREERREERERERERRRREREEERERERERLRNLRGYCFLRIVSRERRKLITADDACRRVITFYWRAPG